MTKPISLKEAYNKRQEGKFSALFEKNFEYMLENFVALEDIEPSSPTFEKVVRGLDAMDKRLQKAESRFPVTVATADTLWENLRKSVEAKKPSALDVKQGMVDLLGFYSTLYDLCSYKTAPNLTEAFQPTKDIVFEHLVPATWENPEILKEIRTMTDKEAVSFVFGLSRIKPPIGLKESSGLLKELKVDFDKLQELNNAINKLKSLADAYPQLKTLAKSVEELRANMSNVMQQKGVIAGGVAQAAKNIGKANFAYDALQEFFTQDLKMILELPEIDKVKAQPDQPISAALGTDVSKVQKIITGRMNPGIFSQFIRFVTGGMQPNIASVLKVDDFAKDLVGLSYNQLKALSTQATSLLPAKQVDAATGPVLQQAGEEAKAEGNGQAPGNEPEVDTSGPTTPDKLQAMLKKNNNDLMKTAVQFLNADGKSLTDANLVFLIKKHAEGKDKDVLSALTKAAQRNQPTGQPPPAQPTT